MSRETRAAAAKYHRRGWCPIPTKHRSKEPNLAQLAPYLSQRASRGELNSWPWDGVGIVTGPVSGILVLDVDGSEGEAELNKRGHPITPMARTGSGGLHLYFRHPEAELRTGIRVAPGLDVKARGGYVVAPPSLGPNGQPYEWIIGPEEVDLADPPEWLSQLLMEPRRNGTSAPPVSDRIPKGQRDRELTSLAGSMRRRGMDEEEIRASLEAVNARRCDPPLEVVQVEKIARSVSRYEPAENGTKEHGQGEQKPPFGGQGAGITKLLADAILEDDHFAQDAGGKLYHYAHGAYRQYAERYIRRRVKEILEEQGASEKWSSHRANETVEYIRADAPELWEKPPTDRVNVANGILHLKSHKLRPHTPDHLSPVQLPVEFEPEARCPAWEKFIAETFPHDAQQLAWEIAADLMIPERSIQKSLLFLGEGSNGKSTALRAYCAFVGSTNVAGLSLQKMEGDRFSVARLVGKLANVCPDLPSTHLTETSVFKAVTGGDMVNAEYKYRESFEFPPFVRLIFSANHAPRSSDASHAFFRRWLVVPFEATFEEAEQIPRAQLDARLADPKELSGVLNKALEALPRLRRHGFTESQSMRDAWEEFRQMTDPLAVWLENHTVEHSSAFVAKRDLLSEYNSHCERAGRAGMTNQAFGRAFRRLKPHIEDGQREVDGKPKTWVWLGLGLRSTEPSPPDGRGTGSRLSRDSRDYSNCFGNGPERTEREVGQEEVTNKGERVNHVKGVNARQERRVERLVHEGMAEQIAREQVYGKCAHGLARCYPCDECDVGARFGGEV